MTKTPEEQASGLTSRLRDLSGVPLADVAAAVKAGDAGIAESLRRIAPRDGAGVPVAAFNSSI
jgi:FXSXX-COOH protein